jgi:molybdopterin synthase catalytic subunit
MIIEVHVQTEDFDVSHWMARLRGHDRRIGALASFVGTVRDLNDGESVAELELEHYPGMTEKSLRNMAEEAARRWPLQGAVIIHRVGRLSPGEQIVLVVCASAHRQAALESCAFLMDYLKTRAPFWKREQTPSGARWVDARETDEQALARWQRSL